MPGREEGGGVWPPPPLHQKSPGERPPGPVFRVWVLPLSVGVGLAVGLLDVSQAEGLLVDWLFFGIAALLGFLQPKTSWLSAIILSGCLYVVHVFAIMHGVKPPYVEPTVADAVYTWPSLALNVFGAFLGVLVRLLGRRSAP